MGHLKIYTFVICMMFSFNSFVTAKADSSSGSKNSIQKDKKIMKGSDWKSEFTTWMVKDICENKILINFSEYIKYSDMLTKIEIPEFSSEAEMTAWSKNTEDTKIKHWDAGVKSHNLDFNKSWKSELTEVEDLNTLASDIITFANTNCPLVIKTNPSNIETQAKVLSIIVGLIKY